MKILLPIAHALHRRNLLDSGAVAALEKRGHTVMILDSLRPRFARLRRSLRLMTLVQRELTGATYRHKATLRTGRAKWEAAGWRLLRNRGVDLERAAIRIEGKIPLDLSDYAVAPFTWANMVLWPTLVHMDATDNDLIKLARALEVPVTAALASWDNLTTKGAFLVRPDRLLVWGPESWRHAIELHGFTRDQVDAPGPPHFWPYESWIAPLGQKILVAGTSLHYWSQEKAFVAALEKEFPGRVLHRLHPRTRGGWSMDIEGPRRDLLQARVVVAAFSTIVIEAALMGRPSILVAFGNGEQGQALDHLAYEHMATVTNWNGVSVAKSMEQLIDYVNEYVDMKPNLLDVWPGSVGVQERKLALRIANCEPGIIDRFCDAVERAR